MNFEVSILIYIYLAICVCMLAFNIAYVSHRKFEDLYMPKKIRRWEKRIQSLLYLNEALTDKKRNALVQKLKKASQLSVFYKAVRNFFDSEENEQMRSWLKRNRKIFEELSVLYMKRPAIEKAYYAFLMKEFQLGSMQELDDIVRFALELVNPSNADREDALRTLNAFGRIEPVAKAYEFINRNREMFNEISTSGLKSTDIQKAYYDILMEKFQLKSTYEWDIIVKFMLELVIEPSIYCRENALQALYSFGRIEPVVKAYEFINRNGVEHSSKLVTDGLLSFTGDKNELVEAIWAKWDVFSSFYQTAFLNFFRMTTGNLCQRLLPILSSKADREVKFAIIRYYRKHYYKEAHRVLLDYVLNVNNEEWEFAALSASALDNYSGEETIKVLLSALNSRNWYVRNNASDSIVTLAPNHPGIQTVLKEKDRFAKEMMEYKLDKHSKKGAS